MSRLFHDGIIDDNTLVQLPDGSTRPYAHVKDGTGTGKPVLPHKPVVPSKPASPKSAAPTPLKRVAMPAIPVEGPSSTYLGECPRCGKKLEGTQVPAKCPHCNAPLHPGSESLWRNYACALKRYLSFRGRARRKEYWAFALCSLLVLFLICVALGATGMPADVLWFIVLVISIPLYYLPGLGVAVRRMHDSGKSGWSFLLKWGLLH